MIPSADLKYRIKRLNIFAVAKLGVFENPVSNSEWFDLKMANLNRRGVNDYGIPR